MPSERLSDDDNGQFAMAIHALLRELGWQHGELTPSLVHQALAQVRHLKKIEERFHRVMDSNVALRFQLGELRNAAASVVLQWNIGALEHVTESEKDRDGLRASIELLGDLTLQRMETSIDEAAALRKFRESFGATHYPDEWKRALAVLDRLLATHEEREG